MLRRSLTLGVALALTLPAAAGAQQPPPARDVPAACAEGALAGLAEWVIAGGKPETLPPYVLGRAGGEEVPVVQRAYRNTGTAVSHALDVATADGGCALVFILDDDVGLTTWVANVAGTLERTWFMAYRGGAPLGNEIVPNERYAAQYDAVKSYFLGRVGQTGDYQQVKRYESWNEPNTRRWPIWRWLHGLFGDDAQ